MGAYKTILSDVDDGTAPPTRPLLEVEVVSGPDSEPVVFLSIANSVTRQVTVNGDVAYHEDTEPFAQIQVNLAELLGALYLGLEPQFAAVASLVGG